MDKTWKAFERTVAEFFGTVRNPLSSRFSRHDTMSDTLHPSLYLEAKRDRAYMGATLSKLIDDTEAKAKKENKLPVICLKRHGKKGFYLLIRADNLHELVQYI